MAPASPFFVRTDSVDEALESMRTNPQARLIAGGTQVMAEQGLGLRSPHGYISLGGVESLRAVVTDETKSQFGPLITLRELSQLASLPDLLRQAVRALATPQVRSRATIGGNIAQPRPDHTLPPCLIALDTQVDVTSASGTDTISMTRLAEQGLPQGAIITAIRTDQHSGDGVFARVGPRNGPCYATASIAVVIDTEHRRVRTGLGGVGRHALAAPDADDVASSSMDWDRCVIDDDAIAAYADAVREACDPVTDVTATAAYRQHAIGVMARRSLSRACEGVRS